MESNKLGIVAVVGLVLALLFRPVAPVQNVINVPESKSAPLGGSVAGQDFFGPRVSFNGNGQWDYSTGFDNASTTVASFITPLNATTTFMAGGVNVYIATTTAIVYEIGRSTVQSATTTRLLYATPSAGNIAFQMGIASTTNADAGIIRTATFGDMVFPPGTKVTLKIGGYQGAANTVKGYFKLKLLEL